MAYGLAAGCGVARTKPGGSVSPAKRDRAHGRKRAGEAVRARLAARAAAVGPGGHGGQVEAQPDVEIKPPAFGQAVGDFLVRDYSERPAEAGAGNMRRFHYQLEPAHAGKHLIRSVSIEFVDKRPNSERRGEAALIETEPLEVNVTSEFGDKGRVWRTSNRCCRRSRCRGLSRWAG